MTRVFQEFFEINLVAAESGFGFGLGGRHRINEGCFRAHDAHAASAAACARLDDDGVAHFLRNGENGFRIFGERTVASRNAGNARFNHGALRVHLVAHEADRVAAGADEGKTALFHPVGEVGVFRQKAVPGVNRFGVRYFRRRNDGRDVEVAFRRGRRADADALVGELHVHRVGVGGGVNDYRFDIHHAAGALNPQGDFAAVGNQDFSEHELRSAKRNHSTTKSGWPNSTGDPFSTSTSRITPSHSASISFMSFMASMMQTVSPAFTLWPISTKDLAPGAGDR